MVDSESSPTAPSLEVIVGTYEQFLIGYRIQQDGNKTGLVQSFTTHAHTGSVRSVAANREWVVSGGSDEVIRIFCMKKRSDVGTLMQQEGTVSCLQIFGESHVFSGSEDGTICIFDTKNWECLKTLRGHKSAVNSFSIHPSGKMLLSVSRDKTLRTWNLIKGRCAYITNLKSVADHVMWAPNGQDFVVSVDTRLDIYNISQAGVAASCDFKKRITCMTFLSENIICVGGESEFVELFYLDQGKSVLKFKAHENRLRGLFSTYGQMREESTYLFSTSSDGYVKLWLFADVEKEPRMMASIDTTCRPTCLCVYIPEGASISQSTTQSSRIREKENRKRILKTEIKASHDNKKRMKTP